MASRADSAMMADSCSLLRKPKTCFKFPLDGRALVANLQMKTNLLLTSHLVIMVCMNELPQSKDPVEEVIDEKWPRLDARILKATLLI